MNPTPPEPGSLTARRARRRIATIDRWGHSETPPHRIRRQKMLNLEKKLVGRWPLLGIGNLVSLQGGKKEPGRRRSISPGMEIWYDSELIPNPSIVCAAIRCPSSFNLVWCGDFGPNMPSEMNSQAAALACRRVAFRIPIISPSTTYSFDKNGIGGNQSGPPAPNCACIREMASPKIANLAGAPCRPNGIAK